VKLCRQAGSNSRRSKAACSITPRVSQAQTNRTARLRAAVRVRSCHSHMRRIRPILLLALAVPVLRGRSESQSPGARRRQGQWLAGVKVKAGESITPLMRTASRDCGSGRPRLILTTTLEGFFPSTDTVAVTAADVRLVSGCTARNPHGHRLCEGRQHRQEIGDASVRSEATRRWQRPTRPACMRFRFHRVTGTHRRPAGFPRVPSRLSVRAGDTLSLTCLFTTPRLRSAKSRASRSAEPRRCYRRASRSKHAARHRLGPERRLHHHRRAHRRATAYLHLCGCRKR